MRNRGTKIARALSALLATCVVGCFPVQAPQRTGYPYNASVPTAPIKQGVALNAVNESTEFKYDSEGDEFDAGKWYYAYLDKALMPEASAEGLLFVGIRNLGSDGWLYHVDVSIFYNGDWRHYSRASVPGGKSLPVVRQGTKVISCRARPCALSEDVRVVLTKAQFLNGVRFKLEGSGLGDFVVSVPSSVTREVARRAGVVPGK